MKFTKTLFGAIELQIVYSVTTLYSIVYLCSKCVPSYILCYNYRIAGNFGGGKFWRIYFNPPKFSLPNFYIYGKCGGEKPVMQDPPRFFPPNT